MSIDARTRRYCDKRDLTAEQILDDILPTAIAANGELAARGIAVRNLAPLRVNVSSVAFTISGSSHGVAISTVRSTLKQVKAKTGTSRQADLVKLFLTGPAAVVRGLD